MRYVHTHGKIWDKSLFILHLQFYLARIIRLIILIVRRGNSPVRIIILIRRITMKAPKKEVSKGSREARPFPVITFKGNMATLPACGDSNAFHLYRGRMSDDPKSSNFSLYYGHYECKDDEGNQLPIPSGFRVTLEPIYDDEKPAKKPTNKPAKMLG